MMLLENLEQDEVSNDIARVLDNLNDITNAISDLADMDSDKFALALKDDNVAGWWGRAWKKIIKVASNVRPILLKAATFIPRLIGRIHHLI